MPTITRLVAQQRNKERVNVYLDGTFAFGLALEEALRLRIGQSLSEHEVEALRDEDGYHKAYQRALDYLSRRPRSQQEMVRYLRDKEVSESQRARIVARLERAGLLDDAAFARYWIENRDAFRPKGPQALRFELRQKGLEDKTINEALAESELDPVEGAMRVARSYLPRLRQIEERQQFHNKLASHLARRGFGWEVIRPIAEQLWAEHQADFPPSE